jgi:ABC-2 type transport system permease protein
MGKYLLITKQAFLVNLAYSSNVLVWSAIAILELLVPLLIWSSAASLTGTFGGMSRDQILSYYGIMSIVGFATFWWIQFEIAAHVRSGDLSNYLLKPVSFFKYMIFQQIGDKSVTALIRIPLFAGVLFLFGSQIIPGFIANFGWVIISIVLGAFLSLLIALSFGMLSFWVTDFGGFAGIYFFTSYLLSGEMAPLSVFPSWFTQIANLLPFRYIISFPIELIMNTLSLSQVIAGIFIEIVWILAFLLLLKILWKKGLTLYQAYGK